MIVGVGGHIGHGKDAFGTGLAECGLYQVNFADGLKEEVLARFRLTMQEVVRREVHNDFWNLEVKPYRWVREVDSDEAWWTRRLRWELWVHKRPVLRRLLQEYGTEVRRADDPDYWVKLWYKRVMAGTVSTLEGEITVDPKKAAGAYATDMRFPNEVAYVRSFSPGLAVVVRRPGAPVDLSHASERLAAEYSEWDAVFVNDSSLDDVRAKARALVAEYRR